MLFPRSSATALTASSTGTISRSRPSPYTSCRGPDGLAPVAEYLPVGVVVVGKAVGNCRVRCLGTTI